MQNRIPIIIFLLSLWIFIQTISAFANEENVIQDTAVNEIMKTREEHSGLQRNLGFSNFLMVGLPLGMRMKKMKTKRQECLFCVLHRHSLRGKFVLTIYTWTTSTKEKQTLMSGGWLWSFR